jgi:phage virion morphogenesis protein
MRRIEITTDEISGALSNLSEHLSDMTPVFQEIGEQLIDSTRQRFALGQSPQGIRWAPKSPTTLAAYGARKSNRVDIRPLFGPSGQLSSRIVYFASAQGVEVGSPMIYAGVQHFGAAKGSLGQTSRGGPIPWGNIPARPFIGLSATDETNILETLSEWIERAAT